MLSLIAILRDHRNLRSYGGKILFNSHKVLLSILLFKVLNNGNVLSIRCFILRFQLESFIIFISIVSQQNIDFPFTNKRKCLQNFIIFVVDKIILNIHPYLLDLLVFLVRVKIQDFISEFFHEILVVLNLIGLLRSL